MGKLVIPKQVKVQVSKELSVLIDENSSNRLDLEKAVKVAREEKEQVENDWWKKLTGK
jgi:hypothetical protein